MMTRVLSAGLLAGLLAGAITAILQSFTTTPLILASEVYENPAHAPHAALEETLRPEKAVAFDVAPLVLVHGPAGAEPAPAGPGGHEHDATAWAPADGMERTFATSAATIATAIGFAFLLLGGMIISGDDVTERNALAWAVGGFIVTGLAPAVGLSPELPGMQAADLFERQSWWILTAAMTAFALWLFLRVDDVRVRALAVVLLLTPHLYGAPHLDVAQAGRLPAELASRFAAMALAVHGVLWISTGLAVGGVWARVASVPDRDRHKGA